MATEKLLISLDEALKATHKEVFWTESEAAAIRSFLVKQPKVDAVEVAHGRWREKFLSVALLRSGDMYALNADVQYRTEVILVSVCTQAKTRD